MKNKWKIIIPVLIVGALAAAFFLQGNEPEGPVAPVTVSAGPVNVDTSVKVDVDPVNVDANTGSVSVDASVGSVNADASVEPLEPVSVDVTAETGNVVTAEGSGPVVPVAFDQSIVDTGAGNAAGTAEATASEATATETAETAAPGAAEAAAPGTAETAAPGTTEAPAPMEVTISISCATINNNLADLDPAKTGLVPEDGWLLKAVTVPFNEGESVFNVLQRVCKQNKLHMEFMNTPVYNSAYIEGIGNLYEFDCGPLSGWMYSVNDWYPNYGCSRYELKAGDVICWNYTCDLGADLGAGFADGEDQKDD